MHAHIIGRLLFNIFDIDFKCFEWMDDWTEPNRTTEYMREAPFVFCTTIAAAMGNQPMK